MITMLPTPGGRAFCVFRLAENVCCWPNDLTNVLRRPVEITADRCLSESKKFDCFNDRYREKLPLEPDQF